MNLIFGDVFIPMNNFIDPPNDDDDLWSNGRETITYKEFKERFNGNTTEDISLGGWTRVSAVKGKTDGSVSGS